MNIKQLTRVRSLFNAAYVPRETNRHNQLGWVRAIRILGDKWLYAKHIKRGEYVWTPEETPKITARKRTILKEKQS